MVVQKSFSMKFIGMDLLTKALDELPQNAIDSFTEATREGALDVVREAKRIVAVDTGELKASIFVREESSNKFEIVASAPHAGFIEHGTSKMVARPYIRPALYRYSGTWTKKILDRFERKMKGYY